LFNKALIIANPGSGGANADALNAAVGRHAGAMELSLRRLNEGEDVETVARRELPHKYDIAVAAGGDGTVSAVARVASDLRIPVAIAPMGTANMLAQQLHIPGRIDEAMKLLQGESVVRHIDALEINGRRYFLNAGVGVSARAVLDLPPTGKRLFGISAYVWMGIASSITFTPVPCTVSIDEDSQQLRILDLSIINAGFQARGQVPGFPRIEPDDGRLNVLTVWAPSASEYLAHLWRAFFLWRKVNPNVKWSVAEREVNIECAKPTPVQADGDIIGETPVTVRVVPSAVGIVVPSESMNQDVE